jgi:hypothetical protein
MITTSSKDVTFSEDSSPVEQITAGLTRQWLFDHQIVVFKPSSVTHPAIDAWIDCVKATMEQWPTNLPYLAIHDMTSDNVSLTPYARARAEELIQVSTKAGSCAALVVPRTFVGQVIQMFVRTQRKQGIHNEIFFSMQAALDWLKPQMVQVPPT